MANGDSNDYDDDFIDILILQKNILGLRFVSQYRRHHLPIATHIIKLSCQNKCTILYNPQKNH